MDHQFKSGHAARPQRHHEILEGREGGVCRTPQAQAHHVPHLPRFTRACTPPRVSRALMQAAGKRLPAQKASPCIPLHMVAQDCPCMGDAWRTANKHSGPHLAFGLKMCKLIEIDGGACMYAQAIDKIICL